MPLDKSQQRDELLGTVRDALRRAEFYYVRTRRWDMRLLIMSIICGALATVLAGGTVIGGKPALDAVGGSSVQTPKSASGDLEHWMSPSLPAIYRQQTRWKHFSISQKSTPLVWCDMMGYYNRPVRHGQLC